MDIGASFKSFMSYFTQPSDKKLDDIVNVFGVLYFWIVSLVVAYVNLFSVVPRVFGVDDNDPFWLWLHWWLSALAAASMFLNYLLCLRKRSIYVAPMGGGGGGGEAGDSLGKGWGHCVPCQQYTPPRAYHCTVCRRCILKRDVHCYFVGVCVGHANQRHFLVFLFYAGLAGIHAAWCFLAYLDQHLAPVLSLGIHNYLYPVVTAKWLLGYVDSYAYFVLSLFYMSLVLGLGSAGLLYFHMQRVLAGQTSHEAAYKVTTYSRGAARNLQEVFGGHWWLAFLLPVPMKLPSDGIVWHGPKEIKGY